jgi:hypothetical protein
MEYTANKADYNPKGTIPTESLSPLHARGISINTRDLSGMSTGGVVGAAIAAVVVAGLTFWLLIWKCKPKMERTMG